MPAPDCSVEKRLDRPTQCRSVQAQYRWMRPELDWTDFAWIREQWDGPLYIKGVLDARDAARAVDLGATGVVVSNHGGRQLDGAVAWLDALPASAAARKGRAEVLLDGGVRRGTDVLQIFREEIARSMTLKGVARVADLDETWLHPAGCVVSDDPARMAPESERG